MKVDQAGANYSFLGEKQEVRGLKQLRLERSSHIFACLVPNLGRIRRCVFFGGGVLLRVGFEVSLPFPLFSAHFLKIMM